MKDVRYSTQTSDGDPASLQVPHLNYLRAEHDEKSKVSNTTLLFVLLFFLVTATCSTVVNSFQLHSVLVSFSSV